MTGAPELHAHEHPDADEQRGQDHQRAARDDDVEQALRDGRPAAARPAACRHAATPSSPKTRTLTRGPSTATEPTYPPSPSSATTLHDPSPCKPVGWIAPRASASMTLKPSSGMDRPAPSALTTASLRVHSSRKALERGCGASECSQAASCVVMYASARSRASSRWRTRSTSTPTRRLVVTAMTVRPSSCDVLNSMPKAAIEEGSPLRVGAELDGSRIHAQTGCQHPPMERATGHEPVPIAPCMEPLGARELMLVEHGQCRLVRRHPVHQRRPHLDRPFHGRVARVQRTRRVGRRCLVHSRTWCGDGLA